MRLRLAAIRCWHVGIMELGCEPLMDVLLNGSKANIAANVILPVQDPVATDQSDATVWMDDRNGHRLRVMP